MSYRTPSQDATRQRIKSECSGPQPCDRCGWMGDKVYLFVTDYATDAHVWRCDLCAKAEARAWKQRHAP